MRWRTANASRHHASVMSSSDISKKPLSKLKRKIQAGLANNPATSLSPTSSPADGLRPTESLDHNLGAVDVIPTKNFPLQPHLCRLYAPPSALANALPSPSDRRTNDQYFALPKEVFLQPYKRGAFDGPSPDDEVILARQGSSLNASLRK